MYNEEVLKMVQYKVGRYNEWDAFSRLKLKTLQKTWDQIKSKRTNRDVLKYENIT